MAWTESPSPTPVREKMKDHWWWRPGVRPGRRVLVWHILPGDQPAVHGLVKEFQDRLAGLDGLDLVPAEWLHMTTQIVGFADVIGPAELDEMTAAAAERLGRVDPVTVRLGEVSLFSAAVVLRTRPPRALHPVREAIRAAIAQTVAAHQLDDQPEWTPHLSLAYSNGDVPTAPIIAALAERPEPASMTVRGAQLVAQVRDGHLYRWEPLAAVPLRQ
jgi:2'-5' RNA ligase